MNIVDNRLLPWRNLLTQEKYFHLLSSIFKGLQFLIDMCAKITDEKPNRNTIILRHASSRHLKAVWNRSKVQQ